MKYTITIQRKTGTNLYESLMVLTTESRKDYVSAVVSLRQMFMRNKTYLTSSELNDLDVTRCFIEYDLTKGE